MPIARAILFAATAAVLVLAMRAAFFGPPPLEIACAATLGYAALFAAGTIEVRWRMFADALVSGPKGTRGIALTFDVAVESAETKAILDALDAVEVKATFFVVASDAEAHADAARAIADRGHGTELRGADDAMFALRSARAIRDGLSRDVEAFARVYGRKPALWRPSRGHTTPAIARVADDLDLTICGWTLRARGSDDVGRVSSRASDGTIVALEAVEPRAIAQLVAAAREARMDVVALADWAAV